MVHVDDYAVSVSTQWVEHGGVMLPFYESEAMRITGAVPPTRPPTAADYIKAGLRCFDWYDELPTVGGTEVLRRLRSVG